MTSRIGLTLALATALLVLASAPASGKTRTSYFCTNVKAKVIREIKGKTATSSPKLCVKMGMRRGKPIQTGEMWDPSWPIEGPDWPPPGTLPPDAL